MTPIVYVETNWLIACLFPHEQRFKDAIELLAQANNGQCELRVPHIAFIEAEATMEANVNNFTRELEGFEEKLRNARKAGFEVGMYAKQSANDYLKVDRKTLLNSLKSNPAISTFVDPSGEIAEIGRTKANLKLSTKDMKDLYILCAILVDLRKQDPTRPALFMNENHKEFSDQKTKVPLEFYESHRLLYRRGFDNLRTAVGNWTSKFNR